MKMYIHCLRCGKRLKNPEYMKIGFGPTCYKKMLLSRQNESRQMKKKFLLGVENDRETAKISNR